MKTYIFNTNFINNPVKQLIDKQIDFMKNCDGQIVISSKCAMYNYNSHLNYDLPHVKSLCLGLYIENELGEILEDHPIEKRKALFVGSMWRSKDIYIVANNGFFANGLHFNQLIKHEDQANNLSLYQLDKIYFIYLKGDVREHLLLQEYIIEYIEADDWSIITGKVVDSTSILSHANGYTYVYSDIHEDAQLLNSADEGFAIGNDFDLAKLDPAVEHVDSYYFVNKYTERFLNK